MAIEYGTIAVVPKGEWNSSTQYEVANLVTRDGSSYVAHTKPPVGTLPTNPAYWQVSAQGTGKATADSVGTVKPDGVTTVVSADGALSVKTATDTTIGAVKGSRSIRVSEDGGIYIPTSFTQSTELVNLIAGEVFDMMLGKISKAIAVTMGLDQNALLKNMLTNIDANDQNKIPTSAFAHTLYERIGMGTALTAGANLTEAANALNSNLTGIQNNFTEIKTVSIYQTRCDGLIGGYVKSGKVVTVAIQFRVLSPGTNFAMLTGFPVPLLGSGNVPAEMNGIKTLSNETTGVFINSVGSLCVRAAVAQDYISVSGSYLST